MKYILALVISLIISQNAIAGGWLIKDATIEKIGSSNWNQDKFHLKLTGGTGTCTDINFPADLAQSPTAYERMFSMAMTALLSGKKVDIYTYATGVDCNKANLIVIKK